MYPSLKSNHLQARYSHKEREERPRTNRQFSGLAAANRSAAIFNSFFFSSATTGENPGRPSAPRPSTSRPACLRLLLRTLTCKGSAALQKECRNTAAPQPFPSKSQNAAQLRQCPHCPYASAGPLSVRLGSPDTNSINWLNGVIQNLPNLPTRSDSGPQHNFTPRLACHVPPCSRHNNLVDSG